MAVDGDGPMGPTRHDCCDKPVIAAIEGHAVAGGLELALWCDLRVVADDAVFGVFCRRWGVPLIDGGTVRLPRIIGQGPALDLDPHRDGRSTPTRRCASGLATRVVPSGTARDAAVALAAELAALPQVCLRNDRASLYAQWDLALADALRRRDRVRHRHPPRPRRPRRCHALRRRRRPPRHPRLTAGFWRRSTAMSQASGAETFSAGR